MTDSTATYFVSSDTVSTVSRASEEQTILLPVDSAFTRSTLELSVAEEHVPETGRQENDLATDILAGIFIVLFLLFFNKFINILPFLFGCMLRWKESVHVEDSMQIRRSRNEVTLLLVIPFCIIAAKFGFIPQLVSAGFSQPGQILAVFIILSAYIAVRMLCNLMCRRIPCKKTAFKIAACASRTFFSIYTVTAMSVAGIMSLAGASAATVRIVLLHIAAFVYAVFLLRKFQIFKNSCSLFYTILYLCILEILPTVILVASVMFL